MTDRHPTRVGATLVVGGRFHDFDFARLQLLTLLAEHPHVRTRVVADYEDPKVFTDETFVVSYTCDVRPSVAAQDRARTWVEGGGRWFALHGTNAALDLPRPNGVEAPRCSPSWVETLGSQFVAHPPIQPYTVRSVAQHWLVDDLESFDTDDELYLSEYHDWSSLQPLLATTWSGDAKGFAEHDWSFETAGTDQHLVSYLRPLGAGSVLYNTLGHCRSHHDMAPMVEWYPRIERCSWEIAQYTELLRRGLRWCLGDTG
jgi:uncharacterized protein